MSTTIILGIETSCDETAAAVVDAGTLVRASVVASQHALHERYRGVVPEIASRAHLERIAPVVQQALDDAGVTFEQLDAISVGNRPGLIGSLIVGVSAAQALSWALQTPLVGIDHVHAHLYAPNLVHAPPASAIRQPPSAIEYPALGLVVSGGHTSLYVMRSATDVTRIGKTIDDAVGEAFDKAAVILGLGYPGGPAIDRAAEQGDAGSHKLPMSLLDPGSLDFSFSGLKTALLYTVRGRPKGRGKKAVFERSGDDLTDAQRADLAAAFQHTVVETLLIKLRRAVEQLRQRGEPVRAIVVGGGVAANALLRRRVSEFADEHDLPVHVPAMSYCVDNAAMIAGLAHHHLTPDTARTHALDLPALATTTN